MHIIILLLIQKILKNGPLLIKDRNKSTKTKLLKEVSSDDQKKKLTRKLIAITEENVWSVDTAIL